MTITELVEQLERIKSERGDLPVVLVMDYVGGPHGEYNKEKEGPLISVFIFRPNVESPAFVCLRADALSGLSIGQWLDGLRAHHDEDREEEQI